MAEERLIDDDLDKNKKYKFRKNADGEEELYIDDSAEYGEETYGATLYEVPEFTQDDEEAAVLTPEQLAAREEARRREEESKNQLAADCLKKAGELLAQGDYESAVYNITAAEKTECRRGEVFAMKIKALTRNFNDFSALAECVDCSENIRRYCSPEQKAELSAMSAPLKKQIENLEDKAAAVHIEVEEKKAERRAVFEQDRKKSVKWFTFTLVAFLACFVMAIAFGSVIFAKQDGTNLILTIVFAALAVILFVITLFTAHKMWEALRKSSLNEKNSSTRLGREYEDLVDIIKKLRNVLASFEESK